MATVIFQLVGRLMTGNDLPSVSPDVPDNNSNNPLTFTTVKSTSDSTYKIGLSWISYDENDTLPKTDSYVYISATNDIGEIVIPLTYWDFSGGNPLVTLNVPANKSANVYFACDNDTFSNKRPTGFYKFSFDGKFKGSGNIQSLLNYSSSCPSACFYNLFNNCSGIITAPDLPATTLAESCYYQMFVDCINLVETPKLPATTLAESCYESMFANCISLNKINNINADILAAACCQNMFFGCTSLKTVNEQLLSATTLAPYCYFAMFAGCTSLSVTPELPAITLAPYCYGNLFQNCIKLTTTPKISAETLAPYCYFAMFQGCKGLTTVDSNLLSNTELISGCYAYMFNDCTSLTTAPELPAETLAEDCYPNMFLGCTSLSGTPELPATTLAYQCYDSMFRGCISLTTAPELPAETLADRCYSYMFYGCTGLTSAPELLATTLADRCYSYMFNRCTSLNYVKVGFTDWNSNELSTDHWLWGVSPTGTFICPEELDTTLSGDSYIPEGWEILQSIENKYNKDN